MDDRRSREQVEKIMHKEFGMSKFSARWMPRLLTPDQKHTRLVISSGELGTFWSRSSQFSWTFPHPRWVLGPPLRARDQTTIHAVETSLFPPPKKAKVVPSAGKVMASVLWDAKGTQFIEYLQKAKLSMGNTNTMATCWAAAKGNQVKTGVRKESCFTRTMLLHTSLWLQLLMCVTVALNWLITHHILLIWHHQTIFCSPTCKKTPLGWEAVSIGPMMRS